MVAYRARGGDDCSCVRVGKCTFCKLAADSGK